MWQVWRKPQSIVWQCTCFCTCNSSRTLLYMLMESCGLQEVTRRSCSCSVSISRQTTDWLQSKEVSLVWLDLLDSSRWFGWLTPSSSSRLLGTSTSRQQECGAGVRCERCVFAGMAWWWSDYMGEKMWHLLNTFCCTNGVCLHRILAWPFAVRTLVFQCNLIGSLGRTKPCKTVTGWWFGTFSIFPFSWECHPNYCEAGQWPKVLKGVPRCVPQHVLWNRCPGGRCRGSRCRGSHSGSQHEGRSDPRGENWEARRWYGDMGDYMVVTWVVTWVWDGWMVLVIRNCFFSRASLWLFKTQENRRWKRHLGISTIGQEQ